MASASPRVALVTGSGKQRVGWHVAVALAERGYSIAVHYRRSAAEAAETVVKLQQLGVAAEAFAADLTDEQAARGLIASTLGRFGRIDVLANCASVWAPRRLEEVVAADLRANFDANVLSTFVCAQQAGLAMVEQPEGGCIVNFGDWACKRPYMNYAAYLVAKGTIPTLTRCLAVELAARNPRIRVNAVLPGPVMLPPDLPTEEREQALRSTLVKREGSPRNVAQAVLFFVENDYVTGTCLPVDGGRSIYAGGA